MLTSHPSSCGALRTSWLRFCMQVRKTNRRNPRNVLSFWLPDLGSIATDLRINSTILAVFI